MGIPAVVLAVLGGTTEHLAKPQRHVVGMVGRHVGEHRTENLIAVDMAAIEDLGQTIETHRYPRPTHRLLASGSRSTRCRLLKTVDAEIVAEPRRAQRHRARKAAALPANYGREPASYTRRVVRRVSVTSALLALGSVFAVTPAPGAVGAHRERVHVTPTAGSAESVFVVSFTMPERTGLYGSSQRHDVLKASAQSRASDCLKTVDVKVPDAPAGVHVHVTVDPRKLGGHWCESIYRGQIQELRTAVCPRGALCPTYVLVRRTVGQFSLHVRSTAPPAGADGTPPSFAGLQHAFACTPGAQRPGQTTPFTLSWQAATDGLTPSPEIVYEVYLASAPGGEDFSKPTWRTPPGSTSFTTPGLPSHGTFYFVVHARDSAGNEDHNTLEQRGNDPCY